MRIAAVQDGSVNLNVMDLRRSLVPSGVAPKLRTMHFHFEVFSVAISAPAPGCWFGARRLTGLQSAIACARTIWRSGAGLDVFLFKTDFDNGDDVIQDLPVAKDKFRFENTGSAFSELTINDDGGNAVVEYGIDGAGFTLVGVTSTQLMEAQFEFVGLYIDSE